MKLKLVEAAQTIDKMLSSIYKNVFPVFEKYGFTFSSGLPRYRTRFAVKFNGTYKDDSVTIPCVLEVNSTHESIESYNSDVGKYDANAFLRLTFAGKTINLGAVDVNDSSSVDEVLSLGKSEIESAIRPRKDLMSGGFEKKSTDDPEVDEDLLKYSQDAEEQVGERTPLTDEEQAVAQSLKGDYVYSSANSYNLIPAKNDKNVLRTMRDWVVIDKIESEKGEDSYKTFSETVLPDEYKEFLKNLKSQNTPDLASVGKLIESTLANFGVKVSYVGGIVGPSITQYEFTLGSGVKVSDVSSLSKELAMALGVSSVIITPIQGKNTIGIQVPNTEISAVSLDDVLEDMDKSGLSVALGKDTNGNAQSADILKLQHVLIGGTTGSGKSSAINSMLCSLIQQYSPDDVKLVLVDPKQVELSSYKNVPHLLRPIITDAKEADEALKDLTVEMDKRYAVFNKMGVKDIEGYNSLVDKYNKSHDNKLPHMPYIVCVIDELADLMSVAGKSVESSIQRITQKARAAGIHMIVATQRPSTDVVTGIIKSNIPSRIAFSTASGVDSRTILDQQGAEKLLGKGDMLYKPVGASSPTRIQGAYVPDDEVDSIVRNVTNKYKK